MEMTRIMRELMHDAKCVYREHMRLEKEQDDGVVLWNSKWEKLFRRVSDTASDLDDYFMFGKIVGTVDD